MFADTARVTNVRIIIIIIIIMIFRCELWPKAPGKFWNWTGIFFFQKSGNPDRGFQA